jgi:hypothetical protein
MPSGTPGGAAEGGEFGVGRMEAGLESVDFAEPTVALGLPDALGEP